MSKKITVYVPKAVGLMSKSNEPTTYVEKSLTAIERQIIEDVSPRCCDLSDGEIRVFTEKAVAKCVIATGLRYGGEEESAIISSQIKSILEKTRLTTKDISIMIDCAMSGEFLEKDASTVFFTPSQFSIWTRKYEEKIKAVAMKKKIQIEQSKEKKEIPSDKELSKRNYIAISDMIKKASKYESADGLWQDPAFQISGEFFFLFLEEKLVINLTSEYKNRIFNTLRTKVNKDSLIKQCRAYCLADWAYIMHEMGNDLNENGEII